MALDSVGQVYATEIDTEIKDADAFPPTLGSEWYEVSREHYDADELNA